VTISADNDAYLLLISASVAADASGGSGVAGGGTVAVIVTGNKAKALLGDYRRDNSINGAVTISAENIEKLISILMSASGASVR
jgi:hypothetical protein